MTAEFRYIPWSGTKRKHLGKLESLFEGWDPSRGGRFFDPFVGGGSVSWLVRQMYPQTIQIVGDRDPHLTALYRLQVSGSTPQWNPCWADIELQRSYTLDQVHNLSDADKAARLIICTKTSFGSRYETRKDGSWRSTLRTDINQQSLTDYLGGIWDKRWLNSHDRVCESNWADTLKDVGSKDLVFLDPPYTDTMGYGENKWTAADQVEVWEWASAKLAEGVTIVVTNHTDLERLYRRNGFTTQQYSAGTPSKEERFEFVGHCGLTIPDKEMFAF